MKAMMMLVVLGAVALYFLLSAAFDATQAASKKSAQAQEQAVEDMMRAFARK